MPLAVAALTAGVLGVVARGASDAPAPRSDADQVAPKLQATWAFRPDSMESLAKEASLAVIASVVDIRAGEPLTDRSGEDAGEPGEPAIPTQLIDLEVDDALYGEAPARLTLLKTGSAQAWIDGDPPYRVGGRYLLFLTRSTSQAGAYVPPAPDGRLPIEDGVVEPLIDGVVADVLGGDPEAEVRELIIRDLPVG